jgi:alkylation response protein AidB-like acyl-CoA dehydrogenase
MTIVVESTSAETHETSREKLLAAARELRPMLQAQAEEADTNRRLPASTEKALRESGLFKLTTPRRYGGHQVNVRTYMEVSAEIAKGCSSAAWVAMIVGGGNFLTALYNQQAQEEVWGADPEAAVVGVVTAHGKGRKTEDGYVVSGRWGFASGCHHAQWIVLVFDTVDADGNVIGQGAALLPMSEVTIEDTWHVVGMRGTGSNTVVVEDVFVPDHRVLDVLKVAQGEFPTEFTDELEYRVPTLTGLLSTIFGPQLGMAEAALEIAIGTVRKGRSIAYSLHPTSAEAPSYQIAIAKAASLIDTARLLAMRSADSLDESTLQPGYMSTLDRSRVRMQIGQASLAARQAVELLVSVVGAGSFATANPMQRIWRDLETASRHGSINPLLASEDFGRALVGIDTPVTVF